MFSRANYYFAIVLEQVPIAERPAFVMIIAKQSFPWKDCSDKDTVLLGRSGGVLGHFVMFSRAKALLI